MPMTSASFFMYFVFSSSGPFKRFLSDETLQSLNYFIFGCVDFCLPEPRTASNILGGEQCSQRSELC